MRPLASRHIIALAISAAITLGTAGPAFADTHHTSPSAVVTGRAAPVTPAAVAPADAALLAAIGSGGLVPQVAATLTSLVDSVVATVLGGLPAPALPGLPALPTLPVATPELPARPPVTAPEPPAAPPVTPPLLPATPPLPLPVG
ncbi:hypothetical protein [Streptomyces sp. NPDC048338]|uniref:hypothetical protein n=1 Tax=Streptomyces sp. NPDC048338 TaxID=3365536 RepID=UPI00371E98B7